MAPGMIPSVTPTGQIKLTFYNVQPNDSPDSHRPRKRRKRINPAGLVIEAALDMTVCVCCHGEFSKHLTWTWERLTDPTSDHHERDPPSRTHHFEEKHRGNLKQDV